MAQLPESQSQSTEELTFQVVFFLKLTVGTATMDQPLTKREEETESQGHQVLDKAILEVAAEDVRRDGPFVFLNSCWSEPQEDASSNFERLSMIMFLNDGQTSKYYRGQDKLQDWNRSSCTEDHS